MACVLIDDKEIEGIKRGKYISSGDEGDCYLYNGLIFKLYTKKEFERKIFFDLEKSNRIAFPMDILVSLSDKTIIGYTMKEMKGNDLRNGFLDSLELKRLKMSYELIRSELLKYRFIDMKNISLTNTLYDYTNHQFSLIDTSLWTTTGNSNNIEKFNQILMNALSITLDWKRHPLNINQNLFDLYGMYLNGESYFLDFLNELEIATSEKKQSKVLTIKDLM